jgi:uncharacterized membrane protein YhaH (DUF805 family)
MDAPVQLVFFGEVLSGFQLEAVKRDLGHALKLDEARLARLFSGARMVLKRSIAHEEAQRYVKRLAELGAHVRVEPLADAPASAPAAAPVPTAAAAILPAAPLAPLAAPSAAAPPAEEQIVCPNCGETQSKRVLCRACATDMPMGIAAKLEAEQEARAARLAEARARRGLRAPGLVAAADAGGPPIWGLGFSGRMARLPYATASTLLLTVMLLLVVFALQKPGAGRVVFAGLGFAFAFFLSMRLAVLRCHDCNRHGWWSLFLFVPYAGVITSLVLSFMPGSADENDFGDPPHKGRWLYAVLAVIGMCVAIALTARSVIRLMEQEWLISEPDAPAETSQLAEALGSAEAARAFSSEYALAPQHRAFAVSSSGAWGWKSGAASMEDAMRGALANCDANRKPYTAACELINVNGQWAPQTE